MTTSPRKCKVDFIAIVFKQGCKDYRNGQVIRDNKAIGVSLDRQDPQDLQEKQASMVQQVGMVEMVEMA